MRLVKIVAALALMPAGLWCADRGKVKRAPEPTPLDLYLQSMSGTVPEGNSRAGGSLWTPGAAFGRLGTDLRASQRDDILTITVYESASAISSGVTKSARSSGLKASASGVAGHTPKALAPLADISTDTSLQGQGETSRHNELTTTLTARVTQVLPNGNLVVEGARIVGVNSEQQTITLRGVVRPIDLSADNAVESSRLALLEVKVNGRGVVADAVRRPGFLYRLLCGILP